jgi:hypothetical protein
VEKREEKRPLERTRCRQMDNIEMDLRVIEWSGIDWTDLILDRDQWRAVFNTVLNLRVD